VAANASLLTLPDLEVVGRVRNGELDFESPRRRPNQLMRARCDVVLARVADQQQRAGLRSHRRCLRAVFTARVRWSNVSPGAVKWNDRTNSGRKRPRLCT